MSRRLNPYFVAVLLAAVTVMVTAAIALSPVSSITPAPDVGSKIAVEPFEIVRDAPQHLPVETYPQH